MKPAKTLKYRGWKLECDPSEVDEQDPGAGTPLIVESPKGNTATFYCAIDTGEVTGNREDETIPEDVLNWLARVQDEAESYVYE